MRWVAPASYHVTLKFLGWTRAEAIPAVGEALERAAATVEPFRWKAARLGAFPSTARAGVVWAGVDDAAGLDQLAAAVERELAPLGFAPERRRFHAHVTLARLRDPRDVADVLLPLSEQVFSATRVDSVYLMESITKSSGSEYVSIARKGVGRPENAAPRQSQAVQPASFDTSPGTDDGWDRHS
jgi:2'-5' RNA ligase